MCISRFLIAGVLALSGVAHACDFKDKWTGPDKKKHFLAGAAIGAAGTLVFKDPKYGFYAGLAAAALAETRGHCSFQDFAVTAAGAAVGSGVTWYVLPKKNGVFVGLNFKL